MEPLSRDEALEILGAEPVAHLGTIDEEGLPYVTPMSFVVDGDRILFRTMGGHKLEAVRTNPSVCVEVSVYDAATGDWASVIVRGAASEVDDDDLKTATVSKLLEKYEKVMGAPTEHGPALRAVGGLPHILQVDIEEITGMSSGRGWSPRSRPGRL